MARRRLKVGVLRALPGLGDLLCAVPALARLRRAHPQAQVDLLGLPSAAWMVDRYPGLVDRLVPVLAFPGLPELPQDARLTTAFLADAHAEAYDVVVQAQGSGGISNVLATLIGAPLTYGCYPPGGWCPDPDTFVRFDEHRHEAARLVDVVSLLCPEIDDGEDPPFPVRDHERREAAALVPGDPYVVIHPGASREERRWPVQGFAAVASWAADHGLGVVVTGSGAEAPLVHAVGEASGGRAAVLAGTTPLGVLAGVLAGARGVVVNDTGVAHLAAAVGTPCAVLFPWSDPARWLPRGPHRAVRCRSDASRPEEVAAVCEHLASLRSPSP